MIKIARKLRERQGIGHTHLPKRAYASSVYVIDKKDVKIPMCAL